MLALASAIVTANAYYIHPIIAYVADDFGISHAMIGAVPALNQIALAIGIFLFLPLGDRVRNRKLALIFTAAQTAAIALMAVAEDFRLFVAASTILGLFTITPYLLPAYVSKRVPPERLGHATAVLTTGIIAGILVARVGAGVVGEYVGWRAVYWIAAALMLAMTLALPMVMDRGQEREEANESYSALLASLGPIIRAHPEVLVSGTIQACNFGIFLAVWLALGLHLTSPDIGYGADTVGYLAAIAIVNLVVTPRLGAWADRRGARQARLRIALVQFAGTATLLLTGHSLWLILIPLLLMNLVGPVIDVTSRMTFLSQPPEVRTRLMTVFITFMFIGAGIASWASTAAYDYAGWTGTAVLAIAFSTGVVALSWWATTARWRPREDSNLRHPD